jgi:glycerol-3-phosphate acyltransferase PlsY
VTSPGFALPLAAAGFLSGSLPFSVWLARLRGRDVRAVGDGNPGAVNAFKAAGPLPGAAALLLDFLKGALPVAAGFWLVGLRGWLVIPIALAPVLGHAFSPFLGWRGGKAVAVTLGVWSGVTLWAGPCLLGLVFIIGKFVLRLRDAWTVLLGMAALLTATILWWREPQLAVLATANAALLAWTHRKELRP